jgi:hypothetical protein
MATPQCSTQPRAPTHGRHCKHTTNTCPLNSAQGNADSTSSQLEHVHNELWISCLLGKLGTWDPKPQNPFHQQHHAQRLASRRTQRIERQKNMNCLLSWSEVGTPAPIQPTEVALHQCRCPTRPHVIPTHTRLSCRHAALSVRCCVTGFLGCPLATMSS